MDIKIIGEHAEDAIAQLRNCVEFGGVKGVLCADGHLGYAQPVGGVVAYKDAVSISGVGFDIACGNMAVKLPVTYDEVKDRLPAIGEQIAKEISFGIGRSNATSVEAECLDEDAAWELEPVGGLKDLAAKQLGTVGSGNHYVDVFKAQDGKVWVGVHFGSRGLGHKTTTWFLNAAGGKDGMMVDPSVVELKSDLGEQYLKSMRLGGRYAYAGREWVCATVARIIQGTAEYEQVVHNHHNFAFEEEHDGEDLFVVRKGATPAFPGQQCFVGGSMGDISVILEGLDTEAAKENLYSTVHGAGRVMSRSKAAGYRKWKKRRLVKQTAGLIDEADMRRRIAERGTLLYGGGADEAPEVYRKLDDVLAYHTDSVKVLERLEPLIVCMAGANEFDPYKD
jgi:tRNA-splicing ligase RtcB